VVSALLVMTGHAMPAMQASLVVFSIIPFWHLYGIASAGALPRQQRRILTAGSLIYILMLSLGLWLSFSDQSWLPASGSIQQILDWRLNGFAIGVVFFWITMLEHASQKRIRAQEVETLRQQALQARSQRVEINDRSALIDMLTHELKNPLATVRFALASLKQQAQGHKEWLTRIQNIDASVRRMDDLIERVAHFSKIERITAADRSAVLDPAALIQELLSDVSRADRWDIAVEPGLRMQGDRQLLMVILENLMTNASKYAARSHKIRIRASLEQAQPHGQDAASSPASFARVEISNHVDPASLPDERRLFDRYYRHPHAQSHPGMGLGLSVVRTAAQKMGAQVLYRHEGDQVFFTLRMPT
jgi:signal transduction histidine kinase